MIYKYIYKVSRFLLHKATTSYIYALYIYISTIYISTIYIHTHIYNSKFTILINKQISKSLTSITVATHIIQKGLGLMPVIFQIAYGQIFWHVRPQVKDSKIGNLIYQGPFAYCTQETGLRKGEFRLQLKCSKARNQQLQEQWQRLL